LEACCGPFCRKCNRDAQQPRRHHLAEPHHHLHTFAFSSKMRRSEWHPAQGTTRLIPHAGPRWTGFNAGAMRPNGHAARVKAWLG
jgi:hypothetical protein